MVRILAIRGEVVPQVLTFEATIEKVEQGYAALFRGDVEVPPIQHLSNPEVSGELDIKSALIRNPGPYASVKVASGFFRNRERGLPTSYATIFLLDGSTGAPLSIMDGDLVTNWRTGAAAAVATRHLARLNAESIGLIGSGVIAGMALRAISKVRPIKRARVWAPTVDLRTQFARSLSEELGFPVTAVGTPALALAEADVVVTATPSRQPIVTPEMVRPGTHINAIGADGPGKQELDAGLVARAKLVVDRLAQCRVAGELQHPLRLGLMTEAEVHAEIGAVVAGARPGRTSETEITIFDATGVAVQDIVLAALVYEEAVRKGLGTWLEI
jgi:alanine dehydrogenase